MLRVNRMSFLRDMRIFVRTLCIALVAICATQTATARNSGVESSTRICQALAGHSYPIGLTLIKPIPASRFGLHKRNVRTSEPGLRRNAFHYGIDFSSRDRNGNPTSQRFTAGVHGVARVHQGSKWNTISVTVKNGNVIQYMHASQIVVKTGDRVKPSTILGQTGDTGSPGSIHLHIQARDRTGHFIDPDRAVLGLPNRRIGPDQ